MQKKNLYRSRLLIAVTAMLILILVLSAAWSGNPKAPKVAVEPKKAVQNAWASASDLGIYHFTTSVEQTTFPAPLLTNVGRSSQHDSVYIEGDTNVPDRTLAMGLWSNTGSLFNGAGKMEMRVKGDQAEGRVSGGEWEKVDDYSGTFAPGNDLLGYLSGAKNITYLGSENRTLSPAEQADTSKGFANSSTLNASSPVVFQFERYSFDFNGPAFAEHMRLYFEQTLSAKGKLPAGVNLETSDQYSKITGSGEIWVIQGGNQDGLPLRLTMHLDYPETASGEKIAVEIQTNFSNYPKQPRTPPGLTGSVVGFLTRMTTPRSLASIKSAAFSGSLLALALLLVSLMVINNRSKRLYIGFSLVMIFSMVFSPLMQSAQVSAFSIEQANKNAAQEQKQADQARDQAYLTSLTTSTWDAHQDPLAQDTNLTNQLQNTDFPIQQATSSAASSATSATPPVMGVGANPVSTTSFFRNSSIPLTSFNAINPNAPTADPAIDPNSDDDEDGLTYAQEKIVGTEPDMTDTDRDSLSDGVEVVGFVFNGQQWWTDPLEADTNKDGLADGMECPQLVDGSGTSCQDTDSDKTPDVFDRDDDDDGVSDKVDLSASSTTRFAKPFNNANPFKITVEEMTPDKPVFLDIQMRPVITDHIWYAMNVLDWPTNDILGQIQRNPANNSTFASADKTDTNPTDKNGDMRLVPMLEISIKWSGLPSDYSQLPTISSPVARKAGNLKDWLYTKKLVPYGIAVRESDTKGNLTVYVPLNIVMDETGGNKVAFTARMLYWPQPNAAVPVQGAVLSSHELRLVWMVYMLTDSCKSPDVTLPPDGWCSDIKNWNTNNIQMVQTYEENWYLTGVAVREDHGVDVAVIGEKYAASTTSSVQDNLWLASTVLQASFVGARQDINGNRDLDIAKLSTRLQGRDINNDSIPDNASLTVTERWTIPAGITQVYNFSYPTQDDIARLPITDTKQVLNSMYGATTLAVGFSPTLMFAREEKYRSLNLDTRLESTNQVTQNPLDPAAITFKLDPTNTKIDTLAALSWAPFQLLGGKWTAYPLADYLEKVKGQYSEIFKGELGLIDPTSREKDLALEGHLLIAKANYMVLYTGYTNVVTHGAEINLLPGALSDKELFDRLSTAKLFKNPGTVEAVTAVLDKIDDFLFYTRATLTDAKLVTTTRAQRINESAITVGRWARFKNAAGQYANDKFAPIKKAMLKFYNKQLETATGAVKTFKGLHPGYKGLAFVGLVAVLAGVIVAGVYGGLGLAIKTILVVASLVTIALLVNKVMKTYIGVGKLVAYSFSAIGGIKVFFSQMAQHAKETGRAATKAAIVGAIIVGVALFALFISSIISAGIKAGSIAFNRGLADVLGEVIALFVMAAIVAIPVVGQILAALLALADAIISIVCAIKKSESSFCQGGLTGLLAKGITKAIYAGQVMVDLAAPNRLNHTIDPHGINLRDTEKGYSVGNKLEVRGTVTTTIQLSTPDSWQAYLYAWQFSQATLNNSTFDYKYLPKTNDIHSGLDLKQIENEWVSMPGEKLRIVKHINTDSTSIVLDTPGINVSPSIFLAEGYAVPFQECWTIPIPIFPGAVPVCDVRKYDGTTHQDLGQGMKYDVFPATIDGFYQLTLVGNASYRLAWDSQFPTLWDADGDGLLSKAHNGNDPNDSQWDADGDGLSDGYEIQIGSNPASIDSDGDFLTDDLEVIWNTNPKLKDTDGDGLVDGEEVRHQNTFNQDGSGNYTKWVGGWTIVYLFNPLGGTKSTYVVSNPLSADGDEDGISDPRERVYGFNPGVKNAENVLTLNTSFNETGAPVMLLRMEDAVGATAFADSSGNSNALTCSDAACPTRVEGKFGKAFQFDGTKNYLTGTVLEAPTFKAGITLSAWVKWGGSNGSGTHTIAYFGTPGVDGIGLSVSDSGALMVTAGGNSPVTSSNAFLQKDVWQNVFLGAWIGTPIYNLVVDNVVKSMPNSVTGVVVPGPGFSLGATPSGVAKFNGAIDEVNLYNYTSSGPEPRNRIFSGNYQVNDQVVKPGDSISYQATVKNELTNRFAQGLLDSTIQGSPSNAPIPQTFILQPQEKQTLSGTVNTSGVTATGVYTLTQQAGALVTDWSTASNGAVMWLNMENVGKDYGDTSGSVPPNPAICSSVSCPTQVTGMVGHAAKFDSFNYLNDNLVLDDLNPTPPTYALSFGGWINPASTPVDGAIFIFSSGNKNLNKLLYRPLGQFSYYDDVVGYQDSFAGYTAGTWHYVMVTIDAANKGVLYVDGVVARNFTTTTRPDPSGQMFVGVKYSGIVDELRVYNKALTQSEVRSLANHPILDFDMSKPSYTNGAVGDFYTDLSGGGGTALCDTSWCPKTKFDGTNYVSFKGSATLSDHFTLSAWVFPENSGDSAKDNHDQGILGYGSGQKYAYPTLQRRGRQVIFGFGNGTTWLYKGSPLNVLTLGQWNHILATFDSGRYRLYINGVEAMPEDDLTFKNTFPLGYSNFDIGRSSNQATLFIDSFWTGYNGDCCAKSSASFFWTTSTNVWSELWYGGGIGDNQYTNVKKSYTFTDNGLLEFREMDSRTTQFYRAFSTNDPRATWLHQPYSAYGEGNVYYGGTLHAGGGSNPDPLGPKAFDNNSIPFNGKIGRVKIFQMTLAPEDVVTVFNEGVSSLYQNFDEPPGAGYPNANFGFASQVDLTGQLTCSSVSTCPTAGLAGRTNQAILFDGIDDTLKVGDPSVLGLNNQSFTIAAWIKGANYTGDKVVLGSFNGGFRVGVTGGLPFMDYLIDNGIAVRTVQYKGFQTLIPNEWNHLVWKITVDPNPVPGLFGSVSLSNYVNGVFESSSERYGNLVLDTSAMHMGGAQTSTYFKGLIDDVRIYRQGLTDAEILALYQSAPILQLHLDDIQKSTNFVDDSNNKNNGTCSGVSCPKAGIQGQVKDSVLFDGIDDFIHLNRTPSTAINNVTMAAWVKWNGPNSDNPLIAYNGQASANGYGMYLTQDGRPSVYVGAKGWGIQLDAPLSTVGWQHLAAVRDNGAWKLYLNGNLAKTVTGSAAPITPSGGFYIGATNNGFSYFNGGIDEVVFYSRVLSDAEIKRIFDYQLGLVNDKQAYRLTVDATLPTANWMNPVTYLPNLDKVWQVDAQDLGSGINRGEMSVNNGPWLDMPRCADAATSGVFCPTFDPRAYNNGGAYNVRLRALDVAGNFGNPSTLNFYVDGTAPTLNTTIQPNSVVGLTPDPAAPSTWLLNIAGTASDPVISGTAQPGSGLTSVEVSLLDATGLPAGSGTQAATIAGSDWSASYALYAADPSGVYTMTVKATDAVENVTTRVVSFSLDGAAPLVSINASIIPTSTLKTSTPLSGLVDDTQASLPFPAGVNTAEIEYTPLGGSTVYNEQPPAGEVLHLSLGDSAGPDGSLFFQDISGQNHTAVCGFACPSTGAPGHLSGAIQLDGQQAVSADAALAGLVGHTSMSFGAWVYPSAAGPTNQAILAFQTNAGANQSVLYYNADKTIGFDSASLGSHNTLTLFEAGHWMHVFAVVTDLSGSTQIDLYVNGALALTFSGAGAPPAVGQLLTIGQRYDSLSPTNGFVGLLDEARLFNRALSAAEIKSIYQGSGPLLHYSFDVNYLLDGALISDSSGWGHNGALSTLDASVTNHRTPGAVGSGALQTDGVNDAVVFTPGVGNIAISLAGQSFTVALWAKRDQLGRIDLAIGQGSGGANQILTLGFLANNAFACDFGQDSLTYANPNPDLLWHHWACTYNIQTHTRSIYRDGAVVASGTSLTGYLGSGNLAIGALNGAQFKGQLDDVLIYPRDLSVLEIASLAHSSWRPIYTASGQVNSAPWNASIPQGLEGLYQLDLRGTDTLNNTSVYQNQLQPVIDTLAPRGALTQISGSTTITYTFTVEDFNLAESSLDFAMCSHVPASRTYFNAPWYRAAMAEEGSSTDRLFGLTVSCAYPSGYTPDLTAKACDLAGNCTICTLSGCTVQGALNGPAPLEPPTNLLPTATLTPTLTATPPVTLTLMPTLVATSPVTATLTATPPLTATQTVTGALLQPVSFKIDSAFAGSQAKAPAPVAQPVVSQVQNSSASSTRVSLGDILQANLSGMVSFFQSLWRNLGSFFQVASPGSDPVSDSLQPQTTENRQEAAPAVPASVTAIGFTNGMAASLVLGQLDFTSNITATTQTGMFGPSGVAVDPTTGKVFVAEFTNNRVLRFASLAALTNGAAAEAVLGQPNFTSITGAATQSGMFGPGRIYVDTAGRLWVPDGTNNRVLRYDNASSKVNGANADGVLGQPNFTSNLAATTQNGMNFPTGVYANASGALWVAEGSNNRVLRFINAAAKANGANADGVLGQLDFITRTAAAGQNLVNFASGVYEDSAGRLWVTDRNNNRVLRFDSAALKANGSNADGVLGQLDFTTITSATTQNRMNFPNGVIGDLAGNVYVADTKNNRVLVFDSFSSPADGADASAVLGQPDFTSNTAATTATGMSGPRGLFSDPSLGSLWVSEYANNRVVMYQSCATTVTSTADSGPGSLRDALSGICAGGTVNFDPSLAGQTIRLASTLTLDRNVTIDGTGLATADSIILSGDTDGNGSGDVGVLHINAGVSVNLNYLTITKGALAVGAGIYNDGSLTLTGSALTDNIASQYGGGIFSNVSGTLVIANSTFSGNTSGFDYGGGIHNDGIATIYNSTFSGNSAAILNGDTLPATLTMVNTIMANSTSNDCVNYGLLGTVSYNVVEGVGGGTCGLTDGANFNSVGADPVLGPLASNGGPQTFSLLTGSPAINTGDAATCNNTTVNNIDQRGVSRPPLGFRCDIGAYEVYDATSPIAILDTGPISPTNSSSAVLTFHATDNFSAPAYLKYQCGLDGATSAPCTSPFTYLNLADGVHYVFLYVFDEIGNFQYYGDFARWRVDITAPDTTILTHPAATTVSTSADFTFSSPEATATFECQMDSAGFAACTNPKNYTGLGLGSHTFEVRAKDTIGNVDSTPASFTFTVISAGTTITASNARTWNTYQVPATTFLPVDTIYYVADVTNTTGITQTVSVNMLVSGPCGTILNHTFSTPVIPGLSTLFINTSLTGATGCGGTYNYTFGVTYNSVTSNSATTFNVITAASNVQVHLLSPAPSTYTTTGLIKIEVSGGSDVGLKQLLLSAGGVTILNQTWTPGQATTMDIINYWSPLALPNGTTTLTAALTDQTDAVATDSVQITVNIAPPSVSLSSTKFSGVDNENSKLTLLGTASDANGLKSVQVWVEGPNLPKAELPTTLNGGAWSAIWPIKPGTLPDGVNYTVTARATNLAGRTTTITGPVLVDLAAPAPVIPQITANSITIQPGSTLTQTGSVNLSWSASSDASGLMGYSAGWLRTSALGILTTQLQSFAPGATRLSVITTQEPEKLEALIGITDVYNNTRWQQLGPIYVDTKWTPDFILLDKLSSETTHHWMSSFCSDLGVDRRVSQLANGVSALTSEQRFYATWDTTALRLAWTGANWSGDGDLFIYIDSAPGGSVTAYNPFNAPQDPIIGMNRYTSDYLVWVKDSRTAVLMAWNGAAWVQSAVLTDRQYQFNPSLNSGQTDLYLPFSLFNYVAGQPVNVVALATEEGKLNIWGTMPYNTHNSSLATTGNVNNPLASGGFRVNMFYHWNSLASGVCPNNKVPNIVVLGPSLGLEPSQALAPEANGPMYLDTDVRLVLNTNPAGFTYSFNEDNLFGRADVLLPAIPANKPADISTLLGLKGEPVQVSPDQLITYRVNYINYGTDTATGVTVDLSAFNALTLPAGTHLPLEFRDHQVLLLGDIGPGASGTFELTAKVNVAASRIAYYNPCILTNPVASCKKYIDWANLEIRVYDDGHPSSGDPLDYLWADHPVENAVPVFVGINPGIGTFTSGTNNLTGYAYAETGVPQVNLELQAAGHTNAVVPCPQTTPEDGSWNCALNLDTVMGTPLTNETALSIRSQAVSGHGLESAWSPFQTFKIDKVAPTVALSATSPITYNSVTNDMNYILNGLTADLNGISGVDVCLDLSCWPASVVPDQTAPAALAVEDKPVAGLPIAYAASCSTAPVFRSFSVTENLTVSGISVGLQLQHTLRDQVRALLTSPVGTQVLLASGDLNTGTNFQNLSISLSDVSPNDQYQFQSDDILTSVYFGRSARPVEPLSAFKGQNALGTWSLRLCDDVNDTNVGAYLGSHLVFDRAFSGSPTGQWIFHAPNRTIVNPDGYVEAIKIYATDIVGNRSTVPLALNVTLDSVSPLITVTQITHQALITGTLPALTGAATDGSGLQSLSVQVIDPLGIHQVIPLTAVNHNWSYDLKPSGPGNYFLWINAVDTVNNITTSGPYTITLTQTKYHLIYLPVITRNALPTTIINNPAPDLVGSFFLTPGKPNFTAGEPVKINVVVINKGNLATSGSFWVDLHINPGIPITTTNTNWRQTCLVAVCDGIAWTITQPLAPGASVVLTSTVSSYATAYTHWSGSFASGTTDLYLVVDSWNPNSPLPGGLVVESNETNNMAEQHGLVVTALAANVSNPQSLWAAVLDPGRIAAWLWNLFRGLNLRSPPG